jgi:ABC-type spermidine/putrescine transport system permease subunit II
MTVASLGSRASRLAGSSLIVLLYAFLLIPLVAVVAASLTAGEFMRLPPEGLSLRWFARFFQRGDLVEALLMSLRIASCWPSPIATSRWRQPCAR